uniref:Nudix hydrolase domain-containing protein n=2 Tax=Brassica oleracea var. oleracea TaxID=109376 RepID=A0A0D3C9I3_BRAOL
MEYSSKQIESSKYQFGVNVVSLETHLKISFCSIYLSRVILFIGEYYYVDMNCRKKVNYGIRSVSHLLHLPNSSMSVLSSRTGRDRQRYDNNFRLVSGCIPYRLIKDEGSEEDTSVEFVNKLQLLMVSSPNRHDLVFPKGGWEDDETVLEAASREAMEEAGVKGSLREVPLGVWEFRSKSSSCNEEDECFGGCKGYMFALEVTEELEEWPERENRERKWLNVKEALELCRYEWMQRALEEFIRVMQEEEEEIKLRTEEETVQDDSSKLEECQIDPCYCFVVN